MKHLVAVSVGLMVGLAGIQGMAEAQSTLEMVKKRGTVSAGLRNDTAPMGYADKEGNLKGFDIEFAKAIARKLGVALDHKLVTSASRIPMLTSGQVDFVLASMTPSRKRDELVDFTIPYGWTTHQVMVRKDSGIKSIADLAAPRVTANVQGSNTGASFLQRQPKAKMTYFQEWPQTALALKQGKVDAVASATFVLASFIEANPEFTLLPDVYYRDPLAIAVRENDSDWRDALNNAVSELWEEGTYAEIFAQTLGGKPPFELEVMPKE